ncbi:MAG: 5-(carboxyamino)imidazole ribonucleotide mutase [Ruminococcaceae bacterium]|nr:5-(carboxyamino)imidazole ribonucleotide mutase [Oscillospiraceae bacterium]
MKKVAIIIGSDSDMPIAEKAYDTLKELDIPATVHILSAHRTPEEARDIAINARDKGYGAIIAAAGMAAHLAGAIAANTTLPVVGIPVKSGDLGGMDALLSTVQMPSGIPVATVAIGGGVNAALLCAEMFGVTDDTLREKLEKRREENKKAVLEKNRIASEKFNW